VPYDRRVVGLCIEGHRPFVELVDLDKVLAIRITEGWTTWGANPKVYRLVVRVLRGILIRAGGMHGRSASSSQGTMLRHAIAPSGLATSQRKVSSS
jgi:hypothetical protein